VGQLEMFEDGEDDGWVSEEGENVHLATTGGTQQRQHLVDPSEQSGPTDTSGVAGASGFGVGAGLRPWARQLEGVPRLRVYRSG
jgi:hypothetical protein